MGQSHLHHEEHIEGKYIRYGARWIFSLIFIPLSIFLIRPFIAKQVLYRASSYRSCRLYTDSMRQYKKALFIDSDNADGWCDLGDLCKEVKDNDEAIMAYEKAVNAEPESRRAHYSLGMALALHKHQYEKAMEHWEQVKRLGPESKTERDKYLLSYYKLALFSMATGHQKMNNANKAATVLEELLRYYPDDKEAARRLRQIKETGSS